MKADILGVDRLVAPFSVADADVEAAARSQPRARRQSSRKSRAVERTLVRTARRVFAASANDAARFAALYGRDPVSIEEVPNGVTAAGGSLARAGKASRTQGVARIRGAPGRAVRRRGSRPQPGCRGQSSSPPRGDCRDGRSGWPAASATTRACATRPPTSIASASFRKRNSPPCSGRPTWDSIRCCMASGTNLKMLDYAAHGALVLSTEVGARGLGFVGNTHYVTFAPDGLAAALQALEVGPPIAADWPCGRPRARASSSTSPGGASPIGSSSRSRRADRALPVLTS